MDRSDWSAYEKLVLFRLRQNHEATKEIRSLVGTIDKRLVHLETRDKVRAGIISAIVSAGVVLINKLF